MKVAALLANAQHAIQIKQQCRKQEASLEARLLLQHILNVNRAWLIAHDIDFVEENAQIAFEALVARRINGEPIAYILGERDFYGLPLKVTSDTLIPRPDTETLVEAALAKIPDNKTSSILDLGTGTGAVALAIAKYRKNAEVLAVDASEAALAIAQENGKHLNIPNVKFILSDWFNALEKKCFDVIVSNPPYIEQEDVHLSQGDLRFEPLSALASGEDGLDDIRQIIQHAPTHLNPKGWLMLEHGYHQASAVRDLLEQTGFVEVASVLDLAGIQRVTIGTLTLNSYS